ncbi:MAG: PAS domain S-box protein, partial [Nitrospira sp.]|nr:PAS domain S-box protein [Nitrospira sp.]
MKWSIKRRVVAGFGLLLIILVIIGVASYKNLFQLIENNRLATKNRVILKKLEVVLTKITDAETGQRGYIITGDEHYLEPYHAALITINQEMKELRKLTIDNPDYQSRLDNLEPFIIEKLSGLKERIALRKNKGFEAAAQEVRSGKGRTVMDNIRKIISDMEDNERNLLEQRAAEAETIANRTIFIIIFGSSLAFVIVGIASFTTYRELTEHKRAEEAMQESEKRFRAIFDTAQDSVFIKDCYLRYLLVNPAMERLFNLPAAELTGKRDEELFGEEAGKHIKEIDFRVLKGEIIEEEDTKPVKGVLKTFHIIKVPMQDNSGKVTGLCGIARDVTERKRAEEELQKAYDELEQRVEERTAELREINESLQREITERKEIEEKLRTASNEWRTTFDSTSDLIILFDREMNIIKANLATAKFFNKPINEILGEKFFWLFLVTDRPIAECPLKKVEKTKKREE